MSARVKPGKNWYPLPAANLKVYLPAPLSKNQPSILLNEVIDQMVRYQHHHKQSSSPNVVIMEENNRFIIGVNATPSPSSIT